MKKVISIFFMNLFSIAAFSTPAEYFYECDGLADRAEYSVGINLKKNKAGFFDNEVISYMILTATRNLETIPPQTQMIFEGKDAGAEGNLKLYFNLTKKTIALYSINKKHQSTTLGSANCINATPWEELK